MDYEQKHPFLQKLEEYLKNTPKEQIDKDWSDILKDTDSEAYYEKKYKDALERVKELLDSAKKQGHIIVRVEDIENTFPDLKESEDELTWLTKYIEEEAYYLSMDIRDNEDRIKLKKLQRSLAWLEKQKNVSSVERVFRPVAGCDIAYAANQAIKQRQLGYKVVLAFNGAYIPVEEKTADDIVNEYYSWLKKQGKQKPIFNADDWYVSKVDGKIYNAKLIEKQDKQKPTNNVEPKFKPGDTMRTLQEANDGYTDGMPVVISVDDEYYHCTNESIAIKDQDNYEFPPINVKQKHNDKSKFKVGDIVQYITDSTDRRKIEEIDTLCNMYHTDSSPIMFEAEDDWKVVVNAEDVESESANNIEPEFHEGDWVVYNNDICQIVKREEGCNKLVTVFGIEKELVNERNLSTARLWSIEDAKDGDVLASGQVVFIFKEIRDAWLYCHCSFHNGGVFIAESYDMMPYKYFGEVHPATKEQRDLLFQKIAEAGYEWYAGKKELKKIESKNTIVNVPPRELILSIWDLGNEWKELTNGCISTEYGTQLDFIQKHWHESEYYLKEKSRYDVQNV